MKILLMNDLHIDGPLELFPFEELLFKINSYPGIVVLNGDIMDLKNTWKKDVLKTKASILQLKSMEHVHYVGGNHELNYGDLPNSLIINNTYFNHSDLISNPERYTAFRNSEPGASWFKRHIITPIVDAGRHLIEVRPNELMLKFVSELPDYITTCYFAHAHPDKVIEFSVGGKKCYIMPRGVCEVTC